MKFRGNAIFYIFLLTAHIALVWLLPYFPTQDGPSHMYNLVILRDLLNGGKEWGEVYTYTLHATPNLGFHMIAYPLLHFFSPLAAEKIFVSLFILLMGVSVPVFIRTFSGRVFPFAYFVFPVMFNFCLMMGFYSYVITVPLFILALSASWKIRCNPMPQRFVLFNLMGIALFYFHLIPAVLYIMALAFMTLSEPVPIRARFIKSLQLAGVMSPLLLIFIFYMRHMFTAPEQVMPVTHISGIDLSRDFFSFSTVVFDPAQQSAAAILLFLTLFFFAVYIIGNVKKLLRERISVRDIPQNEIFILCFLVSLVLIYFLAPFNFGEGSFFNQRFPWVIFLFLLPLLRCPGRGPALNLCNIAIASAAMFIFVFNARIMHRQSLVVNEFMRGLAADMNKGAYLMLYRDTRSGWSRSDVLLHVASYYGIDKNCVDLGNYEVNYNVFPVKYKRKMSTVPPVDRVEYEPETIKWEKYPSIEYLLAWESAPKGANEIGRFFHVIWKGDKLTIWQRNR